MKKSGFIVAVVLISVLVGCINDIEREQLTTSAVPVSLSVKVQHTQTRIVENAFEVNDAIGLYMLVQPAALGQNRYGDNLKYTYSVSSGFVSEKAVFYPEGNNLYDFIGYYPYDSEKIKIGESSLEIGVRIDQSSDAAFSASDFLVAKSTGLSSSEAPVELIFKHKLAYLNIQIKAGAGYTTDELLAANPSVKIMNAYTKAVYNFENDSFAEKNMLTDVIPHGTWQVRDDMLCGKSVIIIPQTFAASHILAEIEADGVAFECKFDKSIIFKSGFVSDIIFTVSSIQDNVKNEITANIDNWEKASEEIVADAAGVATFISISEIDFTESSIYKVMNGEKQLAEICEEYLVCEELKSKAVVVYPVKNGATDVENGIVVRISESANSLYEGKRFLWNTKTGKLTRVTGDYGFIDCIYIAPDKNIVTFRPENALQLKLEPYLIIDNRKTETNIYSPVKIGTQYWTRSNLKTTKYGNDVKLKLGTNCLDTISPVYCVKEGAYYYSHHAVTGGELAPAGWKIADDTAWEILISYIEGDTSVLKSKTGWSSPFPGTNLTGFNAVPNGFYNGETFNHNGTYNCFWSMKDGDSGEVSRSVLVEKSTNGFRYGGSGKVLGLNVRCVRL